MTKRPGVTMMLNTTSSATSSFPQLWILTTLSYSLCLISNCWILKLSFFKGLRNIKIIGGILQTTLRLNNFTIFKQLGKMRNPVKFCTLCISRKHSPIFFKKRWHLLRWCFCQPKWTAKYEQNIQVLKRIFVKTKQWK